MSKRHFTELAKMVAGLKGKVDEVSRLRFAYELAMVCEHHNDRFDRSRFLLACDAVAR
jgi:hypothetical protein